ncbi:hypothetical protein [Allobaculum mucilyticum]|uniref:hypothetical protein n=1 Tax=Allobaculum mucilyticum TaxID=2834459 RepID=UPI001E37A505|nr:hypothetical protein [Allobaculum mucilyticum]UNT95753.1 hypothetical protein KWG62_10650 [Allobaculum mucilyticum]
MKLIPLRQAQTMWMNALRAKPFTSLTLYTFKKDRSVSLEQKEGKLILHENGYIHQDIELDGSKDKKLLKEAFSREFPRSTRLYLSQTD